MGKLQSDLFKNDPKLEACAVENSAHIHMKKNSVGEHVGKIQTAVIRIDPSLKISAAELNTKTYGQTTADAVQAYKRQRSIINFSYQQSADGIVGIMTILRLDTELKDGQSKLIGKDLAVVDAPMAQGLVRNALNALGQFVLRIDPFRVVR